MAARRRVQKTLRRTLLKSESDSRTVFDRYAEESHFFLLSRWVEAIPGVDNDLWRPTGRP